MKALEIRTIEIGTNIPTYKNHLSNVIVFLRHDEDKIIVRNSEQVEVDIYDNGKLIFSGSKLELFERLTTNQ
jgi:hypothetical protein